MQQEMLNCLAEAQMLIPPDKVFGEGEIEVSVWVPVFCKATDALAGSYRLTYRTNDIQDALYFIETNTFD